jgi:signal peptidase I
MGRPAESVEPVRQAKPLASTETVEQVQPARSFFVELAEILLLAVGLYIVITFAIQTVHVIGFSMVPTLNDNDYVLATKVDLRFTTPSRGDIVILKDPFDNSQDFVKRVIALPGERLKVTHGSVFINGRQLQEPYLPPDLKTADWPIDGSDPNGALIPAGHYFVMGDNRNHSSDSRVFGPVALNQIESRAWIRLLPLDKFGPVVQRPTFLQATAVFERRRAA